MIRFKKRLAIIIFLVLVSATAVVSCGKQGKEEHPAGEHPTDSTEHPSDSTEHPTEHPADSTKN